MPGNQSINTAAANSSKILNESEKKLKRHTKDINSDIQGNKRNDSEARRDKDKFYRNTMTELNKGNYDVNPYDNTPSAQKTDKKDVLSLSNAAYGNSLLEKIANNSNQLEYQNAILKFQERQVDLLSTIANSVVAIGKVVASPEQQGPNGEAPEFQRNVSSMAKALGGADFGTASSLALGSLWKKVDKAGYFQMVKSMVDLVKDLVEDGSFKTMLRDKVKEGVLNALPKGLGDFVREWEKDPVGAIQDRINKAYVSQNKLDRMAAKDFVAFNGIDFKVNRQQTNYTEKAIYSKKTDKTINEVIPEYLAEILATLRKDEAKLYDYENDKFVGRSELAIRERKQNDEKSWKSAYSSSKRDFLDMAKDIRDDWGTNNPAIKSAYDTLFSGTSGNGRLVVADEKRLDDLFKRLMKKYGKDAFTLLSVKGANLSVMLKDLYGGDKAAIAANGKYLQALNQIVSTAANDPTRSYDLSDMFYQLQDWHENNIQGKNGTTQRHSGSGSLSAGGRALEKQINQFVDNADILGGYAQEALGAIRRTSMGDAIDNAVNANNAFINANVVYINASSVVGGGRGRRRRGGGGNFNPPGGGNNNFRDFGTIFNDARNNKPIDEMTAAEQAEYYKGSRFAFDVANGNVSDAADDEEDYAMHYRNYQMFAGDNLSAAWEEIRENTSAQRVQEIKDARQTIEQNKIIWDAVLTYWNLLEQYGISRPAFERLNPGKDGSGRVPSPVALLPFFNERGELINTTQLQSQYRMDGLGTADTYHEKLRESYNDLSANVKGSGPEAAMNIFSTVWNDPRLKGKAGIASGGILGFALGNVLKERGIFKGPHSPLILGATLAGLSYLPSVKNSLNMLFGPDADAKNGNFTNRQIAMAKIMSKIVPMSGAVGGAALWMKTMSKMGPAGQAIGLIGMPVAAGIGMLTTKAMSGKLGDWLFGKKEKDASFFSKVGRFFGDLIPAGVKKLVRGSHNDESEYEMYAHSMGEMRQAYADAVNARRITDSEKTRLINNYDNIQRAIAGLDADPEKKLTSDLAFGRLKDQLNQLLTESSVSDMGDAITRDHNFNMQERGQKLNDYTDAASQDYITRADQAMSGAMAQRKKDGAVSTEMTLEEYREHVAENIANNMRTHESEYEAIQEANEEYNREFDIDPDELEGFIKARDKWDTETDPVKKAQAYVEMQEYVNGIDSDGLRLLRHVHTGAQNLRNSLITAISAEIGSGDIKDIQSYVDNFGSPEVKRIYYMGTPNRGVKGWFNNLTGFGREKERNRVAAMNYASMMPDLMSALDPENIADNIRDFQMQDENGNWVNARDRITPDMINRWTNNYEHIENPEGSNTADPDSGQGINDSKFSARINADWLRIRATDSKALWSMSDFNSISIGGKSGGLVGCSVATMNNILHYLGVPEISPNSLAVEANIHTNSDGVKISFFTSVARKLGLNFVVYSRANNVFNAKFFNKLGNVAMAVLLNNYNGSGHFVFCCKPSNGKITMIDPFGKGYAEQVSIADIALRASKIIAITAGAEIPMVGVRGSYALGESITTVKDIEDDDGVFAGTGSGRMGKRQKSATSAKAKVFQSRGYSADTAAVLDKLTSVESVILATAVANSNNKRHAQKLKNVVHNIDKDTRHDTAHINNLANSPEVVQAQSEANKQETDMARAANGIEALAGTKTDKNGNVVVVQNKEKKGGFLSNLLGGGVNMIKGLPALMGSLLVGGAAIFGGYKIGKLGFDIGKLGVNRFKRDFVNNLGQESRDQEIDPETGEVIDNGHFKDYGRAMNAPKELLRYANVSTKLMSVGAKGIGWGATKGAAGLAKYGEKVAKIPIVGKLIKGLLGLPLKLCNKLMESRLGQWLTKKGLGTAIDMFRAKFAAWMSKIAPTIAKKVSEEGGKKASKNIFKRLPGVSLLWYLGQAAVSAFQGYKHAGQLLHIDESKVPTSLRVKTMFAKMLYDVGPELLVSLLKVTPAGFAGFALDVAIIVMKAIFTWDKIVAMLGLGQDVRDELAENKKDKENEKKAATAIDKAEKDETEKIEAEQKEADFHNRDRSKAIEGQAINTAGANAATANASTNLAAIGGSVSSFAGGAMSSTSGGSYGDVSINTPMPTVKMSNDKGQSAESGDGWIRYTRADGTSYVKRGGSMAWRTNNPGNIMWLGDGSYARKLGAVSYYQNKNGKYAVFPSEEDGWNALYKLLYVDNNTQNYKNLLGSQVFYKFAPGQHGNNPDAYSKTVISKVGSNKILNQYTADEKYKFMAAIKQVEGWNVGKIEGDMKEAVNINATGVDANAAKNMITNPLAAGLNALNVKNSAVNATPKGYTESDIHTSGSSYTQPKAENNTVFDVNPATVPTSTAVASTPTVSNTVNTAVVADNGMENMIKAIISSGGTQASAIVTALASIEKLLGEILKSFNNDRIKLIQDAATTAAK